MRARLVNGAMTAHRRTPDDPVLIGRAPNREAPWVALQVVDSGIGIPAEEISQVTRKFVRGRKAPSGGSGLGLAIASRIASDHGGTLSIQSIVGEGTTVRVTLPAALTA